MMIDYMFVVEFIQMIEAVQLMLLQYFDQTETAQRFYHRNEILQDPFRDFWL